MAIDKFEFAEAFTRFTVEDKQFQQGIKGISRNLDAIQVKLEAVAVHARRVLLIGGAALAGFVKVASDAEETVSKFNAVFKEGAPAAVKWAGEFAEAMNRGKTSILGYLATLQDTFVPVGFAREQAAELSKQMVTLALDMASFHNASEPETINLLTSALVGNHEAVRRFGVIMTEATVKQELQRMGLKGNIQEATNMQKVQARLNIIMRDTADAQGDLARTGGSVANQLRGLKDRAIEFAIEIGTAFLPLIKDAVKWLSDMIKSMQGLTDEQKESIVWWTKTGLIIAGLLVVAPKLVAALKLVAGAYNLIAAAAARAAIAQQASGAAGTTGGLGRAIGGAALAGAGGAALGGAAIAGFIGVGAFQAVPENPIDLPATRTAQRRARQARGLQQESEGLGRTSQAIESSRQLGVRSGEFGREVALRNLETTQRRLGRSLAFVEKSLGEHANKQAEFTEGEVKILKERKANLTRVNEQIDRAIEDIEDRAALVRSQKFKKDIFAEFGLDEEPTESPLEQRQRLARRTSPIPLTARATAFRRTTVTQVGIGQLQATLQSMANQDSGQKELRKISREQLDELVRINEQLEEDRGAAWQ